MQKKFFRILILVIMFGRGIKIILKVDYIFCKARFQKPGFVLPEYFYVSKVAACFKNLIAHNYI